MVGKYKIWRLKNVVVTYRRKRNNLSKQITKNRRMQMQRLVDEFLEDNSNSSPAAANKEFISRHKIKKQKRYLLDTLKNLHKKFLQIAPFVISYTGFNRLRPFWVVHPTLSNRETCACVIHENMDLKIVKIVRTDL